MYHICKQNKKRLVKDTNTEDNFNQMREDGDKTQAASNTVYLWAGKMLFVKRKATF